MSVNDRYDMNQLTHKPQWIEINPNAPEPERIAAAAEVIRAGGLVAFPTETVYGLGANALDQEAVAKIFRAKGRPENDPLIVHIASLDTLSEIVLAIPEKAKGLMEAFFPGALTLLFQRGPRVPKNVTAGLDSVAVRMPAHPVALALIRAAGVPIAAPSANLFMHPSPTTARHVLEDLGERVDVILDGGPCPIGLESTVLDLSATPPQVLRPGGVPVEALQAMLPDLVVSPRYLRLEEEKLEVVSPGMHIKHYSPKAPLFIVSGPRVPALARIAASVRNLADHRIQCGLLLAVEDAEAFAGYSVEIGILGSENNLEEIGRNLFGAIRHLDQSACQVILTREFGEAGVGLAIRDRLFRAAEGQAIHALDIRPYLLEIDGKKLLV